MPFLDKDGLTRLWSKIKNFMNGNAAKGWYNEKAVTIASGTWVRIAATKVNVQSCSGTFTINSQANGKHTIAEMIADTSYNTAVSLTQLSCTHYTAGTGFTKARIVYHNNYQNNYAYLEILSSGTETIRVDFKGIGWYPIDFITGSIPSGYTSKELTFAAGKIIGNLQGSATKLATTRTISLDTAVTSTATNFDGSSNISIPVTDVKEAYLTWGGRNHAATFGPVDAGIIPELGANRFAFAKPEGITIEYTRDGGTTWLDYGASNAAKYSLTAVLGAAGFAVGKSTASSKADANCKLRITFDTGKCNVYTNLRKFAVYVSTSGSTGCTCTIEKALEATPAVWVNTANKVPVSGWTGWNIINVPGFDTYGNTASRQYGRIRFTFEITGQDATYNGFLYTTYSHTAVWDGLRRQPWQEQDICTAMIHLRT